MKEKYFVLYTLVISMILLSLIPKDVSAKTIEDDPKEDLYTVSFLQFFLTVGDPTVSPDNLDDLKDLTEDLIAVSEQTTAPSGVDIREIDISEIGVNESLTITMEGRINTLDYLFLTVFIEDGNKYMVIQFSFDGTDLECRYEYDSDGNNTDTCDISGNEISMEYPRDLFDYDNEEIFVIALTIEGDPSNPLGSQVIYDFAPNEIVSYGTYTGTDLITAWIDSFATMLFGNFLVGGLSFKFFIAILILVGTVFLDRKMRTLHYIGLVLLLLLIYPIMMYSFSLNFASVVGLNFINLMEFTILMLFAVYIILALLQSYQLIRKKNYPYFSALSSMIVESILYLTILNTGGLKPYTTVWFVIALFAISAVVLIISRKRGRSP